MRLMYIIVLSLFTVNNITAQIGWGTWNLNGQVVKIVEDEFSQDSIVNTQTTLFDSLGNIIQIEDVRLGQIRKGLYYFDGNGQDTLTFITLNDTLDHLWKKVYKGTNLHSRQLVEPNGTVLLSTYYHYNSDNQRTGTESYDDEGLTLKAVYVLDSSGLLIQELWYNRDQKLTESWIYKYDKSGNETDNIGVDIEEQVFYHDKYYYNDRNQWVKLESVDVRGNIIDVTEWTYKYDEMKNWIEQRKYEDGALVNIRQRVILYE